MFMLRTKSPGVNPHRKDVINMGQQKAKLDAGKAKKSKISLKQRTVLRWTIAFVLVFAILIGLGLAVSNDWFDGFGPACTVGEIEISRDEYQFNFHSNYASFVNYYSSYLSSIGLDLSKDLSSQMYDQDTTWQEYFEEQTRTSLVDTVGLSETAKAEGIELDEERQAEVDSYVSDLKASAKAEGLSLGAYTRSIYGRKLDEDTVRSSLNRILLAEQYSEYLYDSFEYSDEDLTAEYDANVNDYDTVDYRILTVYADIPNQDTMDDDEYADVTAKAMEDAKIKAEELYESIVGDGNTAIESAFNSVAVRYTQDLLDEIEDKEEVTEDLFLEVAHGQNEVLETSGAEWLYDTARKTGDIAILEETESYSIYMFLNREKENYNVVNVRHILVPFNENNTEATSTTEDNKAKKGAEDLLNSFKAAGATSEAFATLAKQHGTDATAVEGGLMENVKKGDMVAEFDAWIFDDARAAGDYDIVKTQFGYHLVYFEGVGEAAWKVAVDTVLREGDYSEKYNGILEKYPVKIDGMEVYRYEG